MDDQTMTDKALSRPAALHMPLQVAPINRTVSRAALAATLGVAADQLGDDLDELDEDDVL
ncbi:MAG: hypothetical protein ACRDTT_02550 [Pseudonocardiaceae bacterium]